MPTMQNVDFKPKMPEREKNNINTMGPCCPKSRKNKIQMEPVIDRMPQKQNKTKKQNRVNTQSS